MFAKSASFYNPLIYFGMSAKFRKEVSVLLPCSRDRKDVVRLKRFKNIKAKGEALAQAVSLPVRKQEGKFKLEEKLQSNPYTDPGVNSPPETPSTGPQGVFHVDIPSHMETSEFWCDRLWALWTTLLKLYLN